ncbi:MAG: HAD-IA family hydrolase [Chitinophagales bacterium]|nr:HAD-IA family hydrolase [Chitinophagales bacterium]MCZ2392609.1 HAD-IA family hydrolase [Chitinophagales bacterium]
MDNIQALIFDLGNVILPLENEKDWWQTHFLSIFHSPEKVIQLKDDLFFVYYEKGILDTSSFLKTIEPLLLPSFSVNDIYERWNSLLKDIPMHRIHFLNHLKSKYKLYLLSNTNEIHLEYIFQKYGQNIFQDIFDDCFYSYQLKMVKPDSEIYQTLLDAHQLIANECLFMDDKQSNLDGASGLGIQTQIISPDQDIVHVLNFL